MLGCLHRGRPSKREDMEALSIMGMQGGKFFDTMRKERGNQHHEVAASGRQQRRIARAGNEEYRTYWDRLFRGPCVRDAWEVEGSRLCTCERQGG